MTCPPHIADILIKIDGYAEKRDSHILKSLNEVFVDPETIVDVLRYWPEKYHYAAILYLRYRGWDAAAVDDHATATQKYWYRISPNERPIEIIPLHKRDMAHLNRMIDKWIQDPPGK